MQNVKERQTTMVVEVRRDDCFFIPSPQKYLFGSCGRWRTDAGERRGIRQHTLCLAFHLYYNFILIARLMIPGFRVGALSAIKYNWEIMPKEGKKSKMSLTRSGSLYLRFVLPVQERIQRRAKSPVLLSATSSCCNASARLSRMSPDTFLFFYCDHLLMASVVCSVRSLIASDN